MFFKHFSSHPVLPEGWDTRHLWEAQRLVTVAIYEKGAAYRQLTDLSLIYEQLLRDVGEFLDRQAVVINRLLPDVSFRKKVMGCLREYLKSERFHLCSALKKHGSVSIDPVSEAILESISNDARFAEYLRSQKGSDFEGPPREWWNSLVAHSEKSGREGKGR